MTLLLVAGGALLLLMLQSIIYARRVKNLRKAGREAVMIARAAEENYIAVGRRYQNLNASCVKQSKTSIT